MRKRSLQFQSELSPFVPIHICNSTTYGPGPERQSPPSYEGSLSPSDKPSHHKGPLCRQIHLRSVYMEKKESDSLSPMAAASSLFTTSYGRAATAAFPSVGLSAFKCTKYCHKILLLSRSVFEKNHSSDLHAPSIRLKSIFIIFF